MPRTCLTIILAAGEGTRMKSSTPKVLHHIGGMPMIGHVLSTARLAGGSQNLVVVGAEAERVQREIGLIDKNCAIAIQQEQNGTADAVLAGKDWLARSFDDVLVLYGDVPMLRPDSLTKMRQHIAAGADLVVLGFDADDPQGYGRMIVENGQLQAIREHKDASAEEKEISFCNGGIMAFNGKIALATLEAVDNNNAQSEFYLTDVVEILHKAGNKVVAMPVLESELSGVNNRAQLADVEDLWQQRKRLEMMLNGVTLMAPDTVFFCHDTEIGRDSVIEPNVVFGPGVTIAEDVQIRAFSHIEGADVASAAVVGPYARLRPDARLLEGSKVGNFCEVKKAVIGKGAKVNHLSYIGDANVGTGSNIGAGTITCNYDGVNKHHTEIGDNVFVGTNSSLVAPVNLGDGAYIASGSVITKNVPADALGIGRGTHVNKDDYAIKIRSRNAAVKARKKAAEK